MVPIEPGIIPTKSSSAQQKALNITLQPNWGMSAQNQQYMGREIVPSRLPLPDCPNDCRLLMTCYPRYKFPSSFRNTSPHPPKWNSSLLIFQEHCTHQHHVPYSCRPICRAESTWVRLHLCGWLSSRVIQFFVTLHALSHRHKSTLPFAAVQTVKENSSPSILLSLISSHAIGTTRHLQLTEVYCFKWVRAHSTWDIELHPQRLWSS